MSWNLSAFRLKTPSTIYPKKTSFATKKIEKLTENSQIQIVSKSIPIICLKMLKKTSDYAIILQSNQ